MPYVPPHGSTWWRDPKCRFMLSLPRGWRVVSQDTDDHFIAQHEPVGPGRLECSVVYAGPAEAGIRVREVVRAGAAVGKGKYDEALGVARATYSSRVPTESGELYVYTWEFGSARWVCVWTYTIEARRQGEDAARLEYAEATYIAESFALA